MNNKVINMPNDAESYYALAQKKIRQQAYREAIPFLQKACRLKSDRHYIVDLANCYAMTGQVDEAVHLIFDEIINEEEFDEYFYHLSQLYIKAREPNKAFLYGLYYVQLSDDEEYFDELIKMFEVSFNNQQEIQAESALFVTQQLFQYMFSHGRISESIDWISNQPVELQERKEMRNLKAMAYLFVGRYEESEALLEQLLTEDETDIHALCHYTLLLYNTQNKHYSYYLERLNKLHPINEDESFKLGIVLSFLHQHEASQQLLLPIYKKRKTVNAQLFHALSFNYYALGDEVNADVMWQALIKLTGTKAPGPKVIAEGQHYIDDVIRPMLLNEDSHYRKLGIFLLSTLKHKEMLITQELWEELEQLGDQDKLYLSFVFHQLDLVKLKYMHEGLKLYYQNDHDELLLLSWIERVEELIAQGYPLKHLSAVAAAHYYLYKKINGEAISLKSAVDKFQTTHYRLTKALKILRQNNI